MNSDYTISCRNIVHPQLPRDMGPVHYMVACCLQNSEEQCTRSNSDSHTTREEEKSRHHKYRDGHEKDNSPKGETSSTTLRKSEPECKDKAQTIYKQGDNSDDVDPDISNRKGDRYQWRVWRWDTEDLKRCTMKSKTHHATNRRITYELTLQIKGSVRMGQKRTVRSESKPLYVDFCTLHLQNKSMGSYFQVCRC